MNAHFVAAMRRATLSTRASNVAEATRVIQDALAGSTGTASLDVEPPEIQAPPMRPGSTPFPVNPNADVIELPEASRKDSARPETPTTSDRLRKPLGETLRILREGHLATGAMSSLPGMGQTGLGGCAAPPAVPEGAQFQWRSFTGAAGTRRYRLYIPASAAKRPRGLLVMLHGCKQNPDDFATGTDMNTVAEENGVLVAYPGQTGADNASSCWNWFRPGDQGRDSGEPSIIAGLTREIMSEFSVERDQVFVAGLSAGGAMAAVMGETYPDIYAAVGIHSGLAYGSANDVMSAFSAMRGDVGLAARNPTRAATGLTRTIVFHGAADRTVHPSNAERIVAAVAPHRADATMRRESGRRTDGRTYARTILADPAGLPIVEQWLVDGAGHAWSGGRAAGSFTDPKGPDASTEMVRFFLAELT